MFYNNDFFSKPFVQTREKFINTKSEEMSDKVAKLAKMSDNVAKLAELRDKVVSKVLFAKIENEKIISIDNETRDLEKMLNYYNNYGFIKIKINETKLKMYIDKIIKDLDNETKNKIKVDNKPSIIIQMIREQKYGLYLINKDDFNELIIPKILISNNNEEFYTFLKNRENNNINNMISQEILKKISRFLNVLSNSNTSILILLTDLILKGMIYFFILFQLSFLNKKLLPISQKDQIFDQFLILIDKNNCSKIEDLSFLEYNKDICKIPETVCPEKICPETVCPEKICPEKICSEKICPETNNFWKISTGMLGFIVFVLFILLLINKKKINI